MHPPVFFSHKVLKAILLFFRLHFRKVEVVNVFNNKFNTLPYLQPSSNSSEVHDGCFPIFPIFLISPCITPRVASQLHTLGHHC